VNIAGQRRQNTAISALVAPAVRRRQRLTDREGQQVPEGNHDHLFARFRLAVESHFKQPRTIPDYARELGVTPARLNSASRRVARASALEVVHRRLLAESKRLLLYTMMTTSQVALLSFHGSRLLFTLVHPPRPRTARRLSCASRGGPTKSPAQGPGFLILFWKQAVTAASSSTSAASSAFGGPRRGPWRARLRFP